MVKIYYAVYEIEPQHGKNINEIILAPYETKEEAELARIKYGYCDNNYYVDIMKQKKNTKEVNNYFFGVFFLY